ncbi:Multifunctional non-homologous end joining protein LigD [Methylobacterium crusticola]|uniref:Multifunctional non-homologous end joining protein LigD n=1 Tax=Methylobacterium crusticola TaxID=1697972 RepID=A0ABQ4QZV8_9HYPH|nr:DNA polymerase ligase N-terminal domain-containing protein [Methylobacterium crusticola]GJD50245.1 Multifunctional non-homologous end joining protein LigD [Methylobacterium crusticola]
MPERAGLMYAVQKHAARRLHYDVRLELAGVLKSWAVTRGPSLVAGERRLAIPVQDHGLDYVHFEGVIAPGRYGAGVVLLWDRGTWEPEGDPALGLAAGSLAFRLRGVKLGGRWRLLRMKERPGARRVSWLLVKSADEAARRPGDPDVLEAQARSVATGRTVEEIAAAG